MSDEKKLNPYAPPVDEAPLSESGNASLSGSGNGSLYRVGEKFLMVRDGAELPARCYRTNEPIQDRVNGRRLSKKVSWCHPAWFLLLLLNILILLIVMLFVSKKARIDFSVSSAVFRKKLIWRSLWGLAFFGGIGVFIFGSINDENGYIVVGGFLVLFGLIGSLICSGYFKAKKHADGWFTVKGCHPDFLESIREEQRESGLANMLY